MTNLDSVLKSRGTILPTKVRIIKAVVFPGVTYGCESWTIKSLSTEELMLLNCDAGENSWESVGQLGDKPVNPKGNYPWIFIGRTDAEAEAPILWPPDVKSWLIGKDPIPGKDWRQKEKETTEDKMVERHHGLKGHEFEQTPGDSEGQGSLACCIPWGHKQLDTTEGLRINIPN